MEKLINLIPWLIAVGIFVTPVRLYDALSAQNDANAATYASKESVQSLTQDIAGIKAQQSRDHDLLIRIAYKLGVK